MSYDDDDNYDEDEEYDEYAEIDDEYPEPGQGYVGDAETLVAPFDRHHRHGAHDAAVVIAADRP